MRCFGLFLLCCTGKVSVLKYHTGNKKTMSLKKKIAISFLISAAIIAVLTAFEYVNFIEIKKETRYLETTDTIMRKSLQLRRHEKNYFLYSTQMAKEESEAVHDYVGQLRDILTKNPHIDRKNELALRDRINEYEQRFSTIEVAVRGLTKAFEGIKPAHRSHAEFFPMIESTFLERPSQAADVLEKGFLLPSNHALIFGLRRLDGDIAALRKNGEDILIISKELDKVARENTETVIRISQLAILVIFPIFFIVGIGTLFFISGSAVKRLMLLIKVIEKTGKGNYPHISVSSSEGNAHDEVGLLIDKFNDMEDQLARREEELDRKNRELMQAKKLAAIGTLASGVAHELNNPLNNIYLSAQVLLKEANEHIQPAVKNALGDIVGQTLRVKRIVGDLLEFARGRKPQVEDVELQGLIDHSFKHLKMSHSLDKVRFSVDSYPERVCVQADPAQLEQVFINLFMNAVEAMRYEGSLRVSIKKSDESVTMKITDSGCGIPKDSLDKIFEPFFTTKDRGTGLGLAIVFNILQKHNAEILVESEPEKGTTFIIIFPVKQTGAGGVVSGAVGTSVNDAGEN